MSARRRAYLDRQAFTCNTVAVPSVVLFLLEEASAIAAERGSKRKEGELVRTKRPPRTNPPKRQCSHEEVVA